MTTETTSTSITAAQFTHMSAVEVLNLLCPQGEPAEGVQVEQLWAEEETVIRFADGSALRVSASCEDVALEPAETAGDSVNQESVATDPRAQPAPLVTTRAPEILGDWYTCRVDQGQAVTRSYAVDVDGYAWERVTDRSRPHDPAVYEHLDYDDLPAEFREGSGE